VNGSDQINQRSREKDEEALGSRGAQNMNRNSREDTGILAARSTRSWPSRPIGRAVPVTRVVTATEFWTEYMDYEGDFDIDDYFNFDQSQSLFWSNWRC